MGAPPDRFPTTASWSLHISGSGRKEHTVRGSYWQSLLCLKCRNVWRWLKMSSIRTRGTCFCFCLLSFCLPLWGAFMRLLSRMVLNILPRMPSHLKSKEFYDCMHWSVRVWSLLYKPSLNSTAATQFSRSADTCHKLAIALPQSWELRYPQRQLLKTIGVPSKSCCLPWAELLTCPRPRMMWVENDDNRCLREAPCKPTTESIKCKEKKHRPKITPSAPNLYFDECFCERSKTCN